MSTCDGSSPDVSRTCTIVPAEFVKPPVLRAADSGSEHAVDMYVYNVNTEWSRMVIYEDITE